MNQTDIKFVGGPRHGLIATKKPWHMEWPPRRVACIDEIKVGERIGLYVLRGSELHWHIPKPEKRKT